MLPVQTNRLGLVRPISVGSKKRISLFSKEQSPNTYRSFDQSADIFDADFNGWEHESPDAGLGTLNPWQLYKKSMKLKGYWLKVVDYYA